jgi:hypothetical protein
MNSKLIALILIAAGSAFAQTRFSIGIGIGGGSRYYAPPPVYYPQVRPHVYRSVPEWAGGAGYWGEDPDRQHRRAEWYGVQKHQQRERYLYGNSQELWEHQEHERRELRREQRHERNGDYDAADGPAHGSSRDGLYRRNH